MLEPTRPGLPGPRSGSIGERLRRALRPAASLLAAVTAVGVATFGGSGCSDQPTPGGGASSPCPAGATCQTRLTILHTSDIHSRLFPYDLLITKIDADLGLGALGDNSGDRGLASALAVSYVGAFTSLGERSPAVPGGYGGLVGQSATRAIEAAMLAIAPPRAERPSALTDVAPNTPASSVAPANPPRQSATMPSVPRIT